MENGNVPEDLRKLDEKIRRIGSRLQKDKKKNVEGHSVASRVGIAVAADLVAGVLVGSGIGYVLDRLFGTKPVLLAVFVLFGGAAGFLNMYRTVKEEEKKGR